VACLTYSHLADTWPSLRENPVFRRAFAPRGIRTLLRSPIARSVVLTAVALAALELVHRATMSLGIALLATVLFWFVIEGMQRWFCWIEVAALTSTGTLHDYANSGLSRADVVLGLLYPAEIAGHIAVLMILAWFGYTSDSPTTRLILVVFAALRLKAIADPPALSLPDAENYLRRRGPLALLSISLGVLGPILLWFVVLFATMFALQAVLAPAGIALPPWMAQVVPLALTFVVAQVLFAIWFRWRLKRFYARHGSFDAMFDRYLEGGEDAPLPRQAAGR
jgi:hypothetical protein